MIKIAHLGSYNRNAGDNIAILNARLSIEKSLKKLGIPKTEYRWISVDIVEILEKINNSYFCKNYFKQLSKVCDVLVIGGGGLIEGEKKSFTGFKLPFDEEILSIFNLPIIVYGVGINHFRSPNGGNEREISKKGLKNLKLLIDKSSLFSLRNDGSLETAKGYYGDTRKIQEIPDPGLVFYNLCFNKIGKKTYFQPAWNSSRSIMLGRGFEPRQVKKMLNMIGSFEMSVLPHTIKDYSFPVENNKFCWPQEEFKNLVSFKSFMSIFEHYKMFGQGVVMRGHGQLCSIGLGLPTVTFSTQDKLLNFSIKNGFADYNVDINEKDWDEKIKQKVMLLQNDLSYRNKWLEIRDLRIREYTEKMNNFSDQVAQIIKSAK